MIQQANAYQFPSFKLSLKIPLSCHLRFKAAICRLDQELKTQLSESEYISWVAQWREGHVDLKQVYKWVMGRLLESHYPVPLDGDSPFGLNIEFT